MPKIIPMEVIQTLTTPTTLFSEKLKEALAKDQEVAKAAEPKAPGVAATSEPKAEITAETSPQDAMRIAASIRREKAVRKREKELEAERSQIQQERVEIQKWREANELAKTDKLSALRHLGITYEDVTNQILNDGKLPPEVVATQRATQSAKEIIDERIAEFEKKQADGFKNQQAEQYTQSIKQIDAEVKAIVDSGDKFSLVKESGAYHDVTEYIEKEFHRIGIILPIEVAIEKVEQEIVDGILSLAKIDKVKSQLLLKEEPKSEAPQTSQANQKITTLTNKATATPPSAPKRLTAAERRQRAIDILNGVAVQ